MIYSRSELTPLFCEIFNEVVKCLANSRGPRLTRSRAVRFHGNNSSLFLFNIWDKEQSDLLHRDHFCYQFGYNTVRTITQNGCSNIKCSLNLWINTTRLYYEQALMVSLLEEPVRAATQEPFKYHRDTTGISAAAPFPFIDDFDEFKGFLVPLYVTLISAMHPIIVQVIELCKTPFPKEERRSIIEGRERPRISTTRRSKEEMELFSRNCPQSWKAAILEAHKSKCVHCGKVLTSRTAQMDHIIPWSIEPMRKKSNFQPLCRPCNSKKGNRYSH